MRRPVPSRHSIPSRLLVGSLFLAVALVSKASAAGPVAPSVDAAAVDGNWVSLAPLRLPRISAHVTVYDPVRHRLLVLGGPYLYLGSEIWMLDPNGDARWSRISVPDGPPSRFGPNAVHDAARDRILFFGGFGQGGTGFTDVWALTLAPAIAWQRLDPALGAPPPGGGAQSIYDPVRDRITFVRGGEVWSLSLGDSPAWSRSLPTGAAPSGLAGAAYDAGGDRMLLLSESLGLIWTLNLSGQPSWGLLGPANAPSVFRFYFTTVLDPIRQRVLVFGGQTETGGILNETWALSLSGTPSWSQLPGGGPSARRQSAAAYDPDADRMWVVGGDSYGNDNDAWALGLGAGGTWAQTRTGPDERMQHGAIYDPVGDRMIVFGGGVPGPVNSTWQLPGGGVALDVVPLHEAGPSPPARLDFGQAFDSARNRLLVFGGLGSTRLNDAWALSMGTSPAWEPLTPAGTPPSARSGHSMIYDSSRDRLVVFGGSSGTRLNDVWELSLSGTPSWSPMTVTGTPPEPRFGHRAVYDPVRDRMLVFAGQGSAYKNDVWALDFAEGNTWHQLAPSGSPPEACLYPSMMYDPLGDRVVVYGGKTTNYPTAITSALNLSPALSWTTLAPSGTLPARRFGQTAVYDPLRDRMILYGGSVSGLGYDDVSALYWTRSRSSGVPKPPLAGLSLAGLRPNPARAGVLFAEFALPDAAPARLELFDLAGRRVWAKDVGASGSGVHVVPVATERRLPVGLYVLRLTRGDRSLSSKGVVVE